MNVLDAILARRSVRAYADKAVPEAVMERMRRALRSAPSACNFQPWRFILVQDREIRRKLAESASGQHWMAEAPVIVVGCGMPQNAYKKMGGHGNSVDVDLAIALDHLTLAAAAEGLGTCWIGAFDEPAVKRLLNVPHAVKVVAMTPLGYPAAAGLIHPLEDARRKPPEEIFATNSYDGPPPA
jgi:nitroreductase